MTTPIILMAASVIDWGLLHQESSYCLQELVCLVYLHKKIHGYQPVQVVTTSLCTYHSP